MLNDNFKFTQSNNVVSFLLMVFAGGGNDTLWLRNSLGDVACLWLLLLQLGFEFIKTTQRVIFDPLPTSSFAGVLLF